MIPLGDGSATRWSGCWKRTTIGESLGRTVLSPRPVANDRFKPSLVGRVNARCRLQRPSHPPQQPLQSQSLQRLTIGPRTTCFRFSAGSAIRFSAPLHKGSRKVSHLPPGGVCPDRVVAGFDIFSRDWVKSCRRAVLLWPYSCGRGTLTAWRKLRAVTLPMPVWSRPVSAMSMRTNCGI